MPFSRARAPATRPLSPMPTHPFKPPDSDPSKNPPPAGAGSLSMAVLAGLAVDIGGSMMVNIVMTTMYAVQLTAQGVPDADMEDAMRRMPHDSALYMTAMLLCIALSVLGGFVCARVARRDEYRPGLVMAAASAAFSLMIVVTEHGLGDMDVLLIVTAIACNLLGVKFGADRNRRAEAAAGLGPSTP